MSFDRKKEILKAATQSFSQFGYKATTMDHVAKQANVGKGTIYTFFKNKEELFEEIINSLIDDMRTTALTAIDENKTFRENIHQSLYRMLAFRRDHQLAIKLFQEKKEIGTPVVEEMMAKIEQSLLNFIENKIQQAMDAGDLKQNNPKITAFVFMSLYIALIFDWEKQHEPLGKEEISNLIELYVLDGLSAR